MADGFQPLPLLNSHIFLHDRHNHPFSWYNYRRYMPWPTVSREGKSLENSFYPILAMAAYFLYTKKNRLIFREDYDD